VGAGGEVFTGIIEELGRVDTILHQKDGITMGIHAPTVTADLKAGDSIAVNGVCLTTNEVSKSLFSTFVMGETLKQTNLALLHNGDYINLERALRLSDRLGGHIVYGHIDGVARVTGKRHNIVEVSLAQELARFVVEKGSIALDGISLTVQSKKNNIIRIGITPFTEENTNIKYWRVGSKINVETDALMKR
jgi:riboflavin synthase